MNKYESILSMKGIEKDLSILKFYPSHHVLQEMGLLTHDR